MTQFIAIIIIYNYIDTKLVEVVAINGTEDNMSKRGLGRRDFLGAGAGLVASSLIASGTSLNAATSSATPTNTAANPYGVQYYEKITEIWNQISSTELPNIAQAADQATKSLKHNGKLYCQIVGGHMHLGEMRRDRAGNPDYLHNWSRNIEPSRFDPAGKGDFVLFDYPTPFIKGAHDRGAFTVGIRVPYYPNGTTPKGVLAMNELATNPVYADVLPPEDCANLILTTHVPFTDGVLYIPEIPAVRACGSSPQGTFNLYWMLTAEIAMRDKGGAAMGSTEKAQEYMHIVKERGAKIRKNFDQIDAIAKAMVEYVSRGARYWNCPLAGADENSKIEAWSIMVEENTNRASGLAMSKLLSPAELDPSNTGALVSVPKTTFKLSPEKKQHAKAGDFVFIASETSDLKENIAAAQAFKSAGLKVIYIGPKTEGATGEDLPKIADWHIDTFSPEREGVLKVPGMDKKICPTTGVLYALAQYVLNAQFIGHMIKANMTPLLFMGVHLIGGKAYYNVVQELYERRGY